ncbi:MAG TPA: hypothetical protein VGD10_03815 [Allosphingosinicella sp.]|uniref:hypothetical protein n=1 Tax=Allosphingosinicella sp. TaxID=2823234 RepID=UPI002EDA0F38
MFHMPALLNIKTSRSHGFPGPISRALLTLLLCLLAFAVPSKAQQRVIRTITNVATVEWGTGALTGRVNSNRVDVTVADTRTELTVYRLTHEVGSPPLHFDGASCTSSGGEQPFDPSNFGGGITAKAAGEGSATPQSNHVKPTDEIRAGEPLIVEVVRASANVDPAVIDKLTIDLATTDGDRERITLVETGPNTGKFVGGIVTIAAPAVPSDCRLSVRPGEKLVFDTFNPNQDDPFGYSDINVLVDPFGIAFDSATGAPIPGVTISVVDANTGQQAEVFGDDGVSRYPSTLVTGQTVIDSGGNRYDFPPGDYRFPLMRPGRYRLVVQPPAPYVAPSALSPAALAPLRRPDGLAFTIVDGSYGGVIVLDSPAPVRVDIPLDRPAGSLLLAKAASQSIAEPGDMVQYRITVSNPDDRASGTLTLTDFIPEGMRLRPDTVRLNGAELAASASPDGRTLVVQLPTLAAGAASSLTYVLEVRSDARTGDALNRAQLSDANGNRSNVAEAAVKIRRDAIADRLTIIGRVVAGACSADPASLRGVPGVRVMLEDGSYAVTDVDGRYHFEGVKPGLRVVQMDENTLPGTLRAVDCADNSRSGGSAFSRFVEGRGGALKRVDFHAVPDAARAARAVGQDARPKAQSDAAAAGAERDWLAGQQPGIEWLFPETDHNPRAPVVRVAIKHLPGQNVRLTMGGRPVDGVAFDGTRKSADGKVAASLWRGLPLTERDTKFVAEVRNADGSVAETLTRNVHFAASPMRAELVREKSKLVADGITRPVIALRMTDRDGRPVHHGLVGDFEVPAPYYPAVEADAQQARQLAGLERARPVWRVEGEDGIAYIELEPTTASGTVSLRFNFRDGEARREQRVEAWLDPGDRPWTIVGLAAGTVGYNKLEGHMDDLADAKDETLVDGRLALYAKGRISGKWLMTLAYDSDKKEDETQFAGVIDPQAYYTIYADRSERRYDAASIRRLYLRLERPQFYALFGDYDTGIDEPELARYVRSFNGVKAEYRSERLSATAFAADTPTRHRRDEIQGNGLSGPYALRARDILPNSERVTIEIRDRLRSDRIVESRLLTRHIDYAIDYLAGTLRFREPILSRSPSLDPQFIVADYEVDGVAEREINAGGRVSWRSADQKLQVSATAIHDADNRRSTTLGGADVRYRPSESTEIRAEVAVSDTKAKSGAAAVAEGTATAWLVEAEHHGSKYDVIAYAREQEGGFGVGQVNASEQGTRKFGIDGRARITDQLSLTGSAWHEDYLASDARRTAGRLLAEYRTPDIAGRAGITIADDRLADGRTAKSTLLQLGATKRFFGNRLELDAQTEMPIGGKDDSIDFPAQHRFSARYAVNQDVQLIGAYEIADGEKIDARTARVGFELKPWAGARIAATANMQNIAESGPRSFAAFGLSQSLVLDEHWSVDFSLDSNQTLGGIDPADVLNPLHPVASGGFIGNGNILTEDFIAVTAGATYRADLWSITGRAEYRAGDFDNRYGFAAAALRQIGEGSALGGAFNWFVAKSETGVETSTKNLQLSWAHRPSTSRFSFIDKLELRDDSVSGAVAGQPGPIGIPLTVNGNARSRRIVNSLSANWSPTSGGYDRAELSLFWGSRYVADKFGEDDIKGWSNIVGVDARFDISDKVDIGGAFAVRQGTGGDSFAYSGGPSIGLSPFKNGWMSVGWNVVGFHDRDFEDARYTRSGPYVTMRLKFDQNSLKGLGLGR